MDDRLRQVVHLGNISNDKETLSSIHAGILVPMPHVKHTASEAGLIKTSCELT